MAFLLSANSRIQLPNLINVLLFVLERHKQKGLAILDTFYDP